MKNIHFKSLRNPQNANRKIQKKTPTLKYIINIFIKAKNK